MSNPRFLACELAAVEAETHFQFVRISPYFLKMDVSHQSKCVHELGSQTSGQCLQDGILVIMHNSSHS